jgi:hypothetical protein
MPLARHRRQGTRVWLEPVAKQLDAMVAIGDLYHFDRFAAPVSRAGTPARPVPTAVF